MGERVHDVLENQVRETPQRRADAEVRLRRFAGNFALPNLLDSCARYMREDATEIATLRARVEELERQLHGPTKVNEAFKKFLEHLNDRKFAASIEKLREAERKSERLEATLRRIADEELLSHSQECPHELARAALDDEQEKA